MKSLQIIDQKQGSIDKKPGVYESQIRYISIFSFSLTNSNHKPLSNHDKGRSNFFSRIKDVILTLFHKVFFLSIQYLEF